MLGRDAVLLTRVMEWCEAKDHAGVRGESSRLLAALIRHSRSAVRPLSAGSSFLSVNVMTVQH